MSSETILAKNIVKNTCKKNTDNVGLCHNCWSSNCEITLNKFDVAVCSNCK